MVLLCLVVVTEGTMGEVRVITGGTDGLGAADEGPWVVPGKGLVVRGMGGGGDSLVLAPELVVAWVVLAEVLVPPGWPVGPETVVVRREGPIRVVAAVEGDAGVWVLPEGKGGAVVLVAGVGGQWRKSSQQSTRIW